MVCNWLCCEHGGENGPAEGQAHQSGQEKCGKSSLLHPAVAYSHIGICIKGATSGISTSCFPLKKEEESWQCVCS